MTPRRKEAEARKRTWLRDYRRRKYSEARELGKCARCMKVWTPADEAYCRHCKVKLNAYKAAHRAKAK